MLSKKSVNLQRDISNQKNMYMKKFLLSLLCLITVAGTVSAETYKHTFESGSLQKDGGTAMLSDFEWSYTSTTYIGWDNNNVKGIQIGSKNNPNPSYTLSTSAFTGCTIKSVTVESCTANDGDAVLTIKVGNQTSEEYALTSSNTAYTFDCEDTEGEISIHWVATQKAYYIKSITIEYTPAAGMVVIPSPVFKTEEGIYADKVSVIAETDDHEAVLYYTKDGSEPSYQDYVAGVGTTITNRTWQIYETLTTTTTIKAIAVKVAEDGAVYESLMTQATYIVSPTKPFALVNTIESGKKYAICANDSVAIPATGKNYGYIEVVEAATYEKYIETIEYNSFTFTAVEGGYTIQDADERYLYMKGSYNSFNFSETLPAEGAIWNVTIDSDGTATIVNENGKTVYYSIQHNSYGCYGEEIITENHVLPKLYMLREYPTITITPEAKSSLHKIETITVTCEEGIKSSGLKVTASGVSGARFTVSQKDANTLEIKANSPITTTNNAEVKINITGDIMLNPTGMNMALNVPTRYGVRTLVSYTLLGDAAPATITAVSPADGATVEKLSYILFTFTLIPGHSDDEAKQPRLYAEGSTELIPVEYTTNKEGSRTEFVGFEQAALVVTEPITTNGTYILEIPDGYFTDINGRDVKGVTLKYTVKNDGGTNGIEQVTDNANCTVYDLMGRKVETPTRGIYIINGKKTILK